MLRSVLSVMAGYVAIVLSTVIVVMLAALAMGLPLDPNQATPPPRSYILVNLVLGTLCAALGGHVTARIASRAPLGHVLVLAAIVLAAGFAYALSGTSPAHPRWYLLTLPITGAIGVVLGGMLAGGTRAARFSEGAT